MLTNQNTSLTDAAALLAAQDGSGGMAVQPVGITPQTPVIPIQPGNKQLTVTPVSNTLAVDSSAAKTIDYLPLGIALAAFIGGYLLSKE